MCYIIVLKIAQSARRGADLVVWFSGGNDGNDDCERFLSVSGDRTGSDTLTRPPVLRYPPSGLGYLTA